LKIIFNSAVGGSDYGDEKKDYNDRGFEIPDYRLPMRRIEDGD
jgi:hypothetical protein